MDLVYSIFRKQAWKTQFQNEQMEEDMCFKCLAKISANNIVAWVTTFDLDDHVNINWGSHVYIADLNVPWKYHKITSNNCTVTTLEWDMYGYSLLIGDKNGSVSIWTCSTDHNLTNWVQVGSKDFRGEPIIAGTFFHLGKKFMLVNEKADNINYFEKFNYVRFTPSLRTWGGTGLPGCLVVSATGMIGALLINDSGEPMISATNSLAVARYRISVVDISYRQNGNFLIVTSDGRPRSPIHCYEVSIKLVNEKNCTIISQWLPSFFLTFNETMDRVISHVKFLLREGSESLVIGSNSSNGCIIETWELVKKTNPINKVFKKVITEDHPTICWIKKSSFTVGAQLTALATPKMSISYNQSSSSQYVVAAFSNHQVCCLSRELTQQCLFELSSYCEDNIGKIGLQHSSNIQFSDLDISYLGNVFVVCDNMGNLYLFQLLSVAELNGPLTVAYATLQLEYCLVTGLDWWDLAISLRPNMLEAVCNRFSENFQKQSQVLQQKEYTTYLSIRSFLYKMMPGAQSKRSDLMHLMTLHSISNAFKNVLRVSDIMADRDPAESLLNVLKEPIIDIDKILTSLDGKDFTVEPSILQSLHQLIQWIAQLALNVVSRIPEPRDNVGYNLLNDLYAINTVRELLVMIRIWGLLRPNCLPVFIKNIDNLDVLSVTFRLLSRFVQLSGEHDEMLFDECYTLQSQVSITSLSSVAAGIHEVASPALYYQHLPLKLVFGQEPDCLRYNTSSIDTIANGKQHSDYVKDYDVIRNVYIGKYPLTVKQCNRCEGKMQLVGNSRTAAIRVWENRWARNCRCGGRWRTVKVGGQ